MRNPVLDVSPSQKAEIEKLITQINGGDKEAFQSLYDITWKPVYYMLLKRIGDESDALVLLNQVYEEVYTNLRRLENGKAFMKWVTQIMFAESMNFLKEKYKIGTKELQGEAIDVGLEEYDDDLLPEKALINKEEQEMILQTVEELPDTQRETIFMFYYHNLSVSEIADITSSTENTVYKRLHDAKKTLKTKLSGLLSTSTLLYNFTGLGFLREVFQRDIEAQAALVSKAAIWVAPVATNVLVVASAEASVGSLVKVITGSAAKGFFIKTVIVGAAATGLVTVAVTQPYFVRTPVAIENFATPPPTDTVFNEAFHTETSPHQEGSDIAIQETVKLHEPEIVAEEPQVGDVALEGSSPVIDAYATENKAPEPETPAESSFSEQSTGTSEVSPAVEVITERPFTEALSGSTPSIEVPLVEALPEDEPPQEEPLVAESGGSKDSYESDTSHTTAANTTPEASVPVEKIFRFSYEIGRGPENDGVINHLAIFSGRLFNPETDTITIEENDFNPHKVGEYSVKLTALRSTDGKNVHVHATVTVVDTVSPVISVENPVVTLEAGEVVSVDALLEYAGVSVTDNSGESVLPEVEGYENIHFQLPGQYELELGAKDAQGNEAFRRIIIIKIQNFEMEDSYETF